jgi:hypothetical protein
MDTGNKLCALTINTLTWSTEAEKVWIVTVNKCVNN